MCTKVKEHLCNRSRGQAVQHDRQLPPRRTSQEPGLGLALIAGALMAVVLLLALICLVSTGWGPLRTVDLDIVRSLNGYISGHRAQLQFWTMVSLLFGPVVLPTAVLLAAALLWFRGLRRSALLIAVAMIGATSLSSIVKVLVGRARPVPMNPVGSANGYSFPSGHTLSSMVVIGVALLLLLPAVPARGRVPLSAGAVLLAAAVGFSRLILGVHFFSDVLGSWLIGGAWLLVLLAGFRRTLAAQGRPLL